jgi:hypothetical protein
VKKQQIELVNLSSWDEETIENLTRYFRDDLRIKRSFRFLFQEIWTGLDDETGDVLEGTESLETAWDGDAWGWAKKGFIRVCIAPTISFPVVWDINYALKGQYLRRVTWFNTPPEMFIYLAAHEFRHLWQFEHESKRKQIMKLLAIDDETDADFYALRILSRLREDPEAFMSLTEHI